MITSDTTKGSSLTELCDWMDSLSEHVGSGIRHEVTGQEVHAFVLEHGANDILVRREIY